MNRSSRKPFRFADNTPDISVLMTVYNTAAYLAEAMESVMSQQTARSFELIVVDDGSGDDSLRIALDLAERYPGRIHVLRHEDGGNRGISASRNLAIEFAAAPLLAFLDSDDVWLPHHLETQCDVLDRFPAVDFVFAAAERWVDFSKPFDERTARKAWWGSNYIPPILPAGESGGVLAPGALVEWFLKDESLVPCICTVVIRTAAARAAGGFQAEFRGLYDDQVFHAKVARNCGVYANDRCTARYRKHSASCCAQGALDNRVQVAARREFLHFLQRYKATRIPAFQSTQACGGAVDCRSTMLAESSFSGTGPVSSM